jgi:hypothetical protein
VLTRDEAFLLAVNFAAERTVADIEGHSTAAKFGQPRRLSRFARRGSARPNIAKPPEAIRFQKR